MLPFGIIPALRVLGVGLVFPASLCCSGSNQVGAAARAKLRTADGQNFVMALFSDRLGSRGLTRVPFDQLLDRTRQGVASLPANGDFQTATVLANGTALVRCHTGVYPAAEAKVVLRNDPGLNNWRVDQPPAEACKDFSATLFPDGSVLVTGGIGEGGACSPRQNGTFPEQPSCILPAAAAHR
jgi:hypothetical protein